MKSISDLITDRINSNSVFVFPSEAAASGRRRELLKSGGCRAVRNERFLSWDKFKENITLHNRADKPVNSVLRRIFAGDVTERNSTNPMFRRLIPDEYRGHTGTFSDTVLRILPELDMLVRVLDENPGFDSELKADYIKLYHEYTGFLDANGFFEPSWEKPDLGRLDRDYYIIGPEIIEDFGEYRDLLTAAGCSFIPCGGEISEQFRMFENSVAEVDAVLSEAAELLASGCGQSDIAVTSADESVTQILLSRARTRGIPLNCRSGKPLSEHPAGRLPELVRACRMSGFSLSSMKNLLMFRAFIWKNAEAAASLVRFGIENRCIKNTSDRPSGDEWAKRLKVSGGSLYSFYTGLKIRIGKICGSSSFAELSKELQIFVSTYLETDAEIWDADCEKVFQRTREVLSSLCDAEKQLVNVRIPDPLGLWIELLKEKIYVRRQDAPGISVYPYRVSALINPERHFIIGLSHESSAIVSSAFPFLTDLQRRNLNSTELNMTDDFLRIYSFSGKDVRMSCSADTPSGAALAPGVFIENGRIDRVSFRDAGEQAEVSPVQAENLWWNKACSAGFRASAAGPLPAISAVQCEGFGYALDTFMTPKGFDASDESFPSDFASARLIPQVSGDDGRLTVSATTLNRWSACRFSFLITDILSVREDAYILYPEDPWTAGTVLHDILFDFFSRIRESGEAFRFSGRGEHYRLLIENSAAAVFDSWEKKGNYFFGPAWESFRRKAVQLLQRLPEAEAALCDGMRPVRLEEWFSFPVDSEAGIGIKAVGKVDRMSEGPDGAVIVDYKKSWKKKTREKFINKDSSGNLDTPETGYQLPFYILLAREAGYKVAGTSYYSISGAQHFPVSGAGGVLSDEDAEQLCELTLRQINRMAADCTGGDYTAEDRCGGCGLRAVCRKRFTVRWEDR